MNKIVGGLFLTLEGGDGVGKSTLQRSLNQRISEAGVEVIMCREPGGTILGEKLRDALLGSKKNEVDALAELLVFLAARTQLSTEIIKPALERGAVVICDRFADSSIAYQHYGRGIEKSIIEAEQEGNLEEAAQIKFNELHYLQKNINTLKEDFKKLNDLASASEFTFAKRLNSLSSLIFNSEYELFNKPNPLISVKLFSILIFPLKLLSVNIFSLFLFRLTKLKFFKVPTKL